MNRTGLILGFVTGIFITSRPSNAQYTADFQTNIISGATSNWTGDYIVGSNTFRDALLIQNSGLLSNSAGYLGYEVTSSNNSVLVSGTSSVWSNGRPVTIGYSGAGNSLVISNGGLVFSSEGIMGSEASSGNNMMLITGPGSVWKSVNIEIGWYGTGNSLVISDGGQVLNNASSVGYQSSNNCALVTGSGSVWNNGGEIYVGSWSAGNSLVVSNGGQLSSKYGLVFGSNRVLVTGPSSVWSNALSLRVGDSEPPGRRGADMVISNGGLVANASGFVGMSSFGNRVCVAEGGVWRNVSLWVGGTGGSNSLVVAGGTVLATNLVIGAISSTCDNLVQLNSGNVIVTNAGTNAVLEVSYGKLILNGGVLLVDRFVMTNACAQFVRTGGTLIYGTAVLDPNRDDDGDGVPNGWEQSHGRDPLNAADVNADTDGDGQSDLAEFQAGTDPTNSASAFRITDIAQQGDDVRVTWMTGVSRTNVLQATVGDAGGGFTNDFADLFIVTNTVGSVTNYLDAGAATNAPARYYRVRLVP